jgi:hypothetical protein
VTDKKTGLHTFCTDPQCDNNSVILDPSCLLYVYKIALRHYLLSKHLIDPDDVDNQNLVPHIRVRKDKASRSHYDDIQNKDFRITESDISIKNDFMIVELNSKKTDPHMTLIFCKKLGTKVDLLAAFKHVLQTLNANPSSIDLYAKLPYFGQSLSQYWYDVAESFPNQIEIPADYTPQLAADKLNICANTSAAGSIIDCP